MTLTFMSMIRWLFLGLKQKLLVVIGEFGDRGGGGGVMAILTMHRTLKPLLVMHLKWTSWFFDDESLVLTRAKGLLQTFHLFFFFSFDIAKSISAKIRIFTQRWKFMPFSVIQILREINFGGYRTKNAAFAIFWALNFVDLVDFSLLKLQKFIRIKILSFRFCLKSILEDLKY